MSGTAWDSCNTPRCALQLFLQSPSMFQLAGPCVYKRELSFFEGPYLAVLRNHSWQTLGIICDSGVGARVQGARQMPSLLHYRSSPKVLDFVKYPDYKRQGDLKIDPGGSAEPGSFFTRSSQTREDAASQS